MNLDVQIEDELKTFLDEEASRSGYGSTSEYIGAVLNTFWKTASQSTLEAELVRRIEGPPATELPDGFWDDLKSKIRTRRIASRT